jgi:hypothetical protein
MSGSWRKQRSVEGVERVLVMVGSSDGGVYLGAIEAGGKETACKGGQRVRGGRVVALMCHTDERIAEAEGVDDFGGAWEE